MEKYIVSMDADEARRCRSIQSLVSRSLASYNEFCIMCNRLDSRKMWPSSQEEMLSIIGFGFISNNMYMLRCG